MDRSASKIKVEDSSFSLSILQDVSEIINYSENFQETLDKMVNLVAQKLRMDVCSIYLLDSQAKSLVLQATKGLNLQSIGNVKLKQHEGVTSLVIDDMKPIAIENVQEHPKYKYFPETDESPFHSYLGVPIINNKKAIGVLAVQKKKNYVFHIKEINILQILAMQVASVIQVAEILERTSQSELLLEEKKNNLDTVDVVDKTPSTYDRKKVLSLQGIPTSFGYGHGKVLIFDERFNYSYITEQKVVNVDEEIKKLNDAITKSKDQISQISISLKEQVSEDILKIFDSHIMILEDKQLRGKIESQINKGNNAAYSTLLVIDQYVLSFSQINDAYIRERIVDIEDIGRRIINNILGIEHIDLSHIPENSVIVAKFLTPSTTANLDTTKVVGIVTEHGGATSHASILARSLEIPAVVGVKNVLNKINVEDHLIVDGNTGFVFINPHKALVSEYQKAELKNQEYHDFFIKNVSYPLLSQDKIPVKVGANIGMLTDVDIALKNGAKDVGLFRTEFPYMVRNQLPTVEEQCEIYKHVLQSFPEGEVTIRTLDIGGDKLLSYLAVPKEENPCLGHKSTRFLLDNSHILIDQLKAILQVSVHGKIKILLPMITSMNELIQVIDLKEIVQGVFIFKGIDYNDKVEVGMMVEVPSVIFQLEDFFPYVDFLSIGTNDLVQYILAVDRDNEKVSNIFNALHPAVLKALNIIYQKSAKANKRLAVCGEMAGNAKGALALLAIGIRELSCAPSTIPYIHYLTRQVNQKILDDVKDVILSLKNVRDIENYLLKVLGEIAPKLIS